MAGLATAPIAAAHFNMVSQYGLLANLILVPLMGLVIMPAGVIGLMLMPFELEGRGALGDGSRACLDPWRGRLDRGFQ